MIIAYEHRISRANSVKFKTLTDGYLTCMLSHVSHPNISMLVVSMGMLFMVGSFCGANATTSNETSTSADVPSGVNDPGLTSTAPPELSNTTSADVPSGVNDPGLTSTAPPELSNTTSADVPSGVNDPGLTSDS